MMWTPEHFSFRDEYDRRMVARHGAKHVQELFERRRTGMNDLSSVSPGLTIIFKDTSPGLQGDGLDVLLREDGFSDVGEIEGMPLCYTATLAEGGYINTDQGTEICRGFAQGEPDRRTLLLAHSFSGFVRIEGMDGTLLQSPLYLPSGIHTNA